MTSIKEYIIKLISKFHLISFILGIALSALISHEHFKGYSLIQKTNIGGFTIIGNKLYSLTEMRDAAP
jgi:hypothetical protein